MNKLKGDGGIFGRVATDRAGAPIAPAGTDDEAEENASDEAEASSSDIDLKATVTLSGEALAALLEEVKQTRLKTGVRLPPLSAEPVTPPPLSASARTGGAPKGR